VLVVTLTIEGLVNARKSHWLARGTGRLLASLAIVSAVTVVGIVGLGEHDDTNVALLYLFAIAAVSVWLGYLPSVLAALASALCLDYFFLPPYGSLALAGGREALTFAGMFATAVFISTLNERLRKQALAARASERRVVSLYRLARELAETASLDELCMRATAEVEVAGNLVACLLIRRGETFSHAVRSGGVVAIETEDLGAANWASTHLTPAGLGTGSCPGATACYVPLVASRGCVGVLSLRPRQRQEGTDPRPSSLVISMAQHIALAVERVLLSGEKQSAQIEVESERIRSAVLSSVSHDLRAPLAVIGAASSTLVEHGDRLPEPARAEMGRIINQEARRLNDLLKSLFDVTRLQSGRFRVSRQWESLEEIVGGVLRLIDERTAGHVLRANVPTDVPLLQVDATLIEQVLLNLVDNAFKHGRTDRAVEIDVGLRGGVAIISVVDHGRGIAPDEIGKVFEKFYRSAQAASGGLGLGLTIARGIVEAHGGRMWAKQTPGGGLTVQFQLPLSAAPPRLSRIERAAGISNQRSV